MFDARNVLSLDNHFVALLGMGSLLYSFCSGFEMALISLSSQVVRAPLRQADL